jgi:hypothetical protein
VSAHVFDRAQYLGDAVYASFDGYQIWLTTGDGNDQRIALEPDVFRALIAYEKRLRDEISARNAEVEVRETTPYYCRCCGEPTESGEDCCSDDFAEPGEARESV